MVTEQRNESKARRLAKKVGLSVHKSRQSLSIDNHGGFQIVDQYTNTVLDGIRFEMSADDVIAYCESRDQQEER